MRPSPRWSCHPWPLKLRGRCTNQAPALPHTSARPLHSRLLTALAPLLHSQNTNPAAALRNLKLTELRKRALSAGTSEEVVQRALDSEGPR